MALLAVSCQKAAVGGAQELEEAPVPIQLTTNLQVNNVSVTKAGVDAWAAGQKLYIYALPTNEIPTDENKRLVNNAEASAPTDGGTGPARYEKKDITLYADQAAHTFYYYPADKTTLDFYGYYVDNAFVADPTQEGAPTKPAPEITSDNISLKLYLDGSQDIMLAKADKEEDVLEASELISPANAYSAYSARKEVKPNLVFQHQLSRFVFYVVAGNPEGSKVKITGVTLTSKNQAYLVIADKNDGRGIKDPSGDGTFYLKNEDGSKVESCFPQYKDGDGGSYTFDSGNRVGESIMVIPDSANGHKMVMSMQQMNGTGGDATPLGDPFTYEYDLVPRMVDDGTGTKPEAFLPGYQYNVNVVVYGRQQVDISVTLTEWGTGGTITIDNDKEWGDEPKLGYKATNEAGDEYYLYFYGNSNVIEVGMEVKYWKKDTNEMAAPESGTYMFGQNKGTVDSPIWGVTLEKTGEGTNTKTTVKTLITENSTPTPTE